MVTRVLPISKFTSTENFLTQNRHCRQHTLQVIHKLYFPSEQFDSILVVQWLGRWTVDQAVTGLTPQGVNQVT